jgi:hypothetical protein
MKPPNDAGFENHELSIEDSPCTGSDREYAKVENTVMNSALGGGRINTTIHKQN